MPFKKGQVANPEGGRANKTAWRDALNIALKRPYKDTEALAEDFKAPALSVIAAQCVVKAAGGDMMAIKEVADRLDGKPPTVVLGPGEGGEHKITLITRRIVRANN